MATVSMAAEDKRWREESDVRTLAEAEKIKTDKTRFNAAAKRAKVMAADAMKEANAVKKVADKRIVGAASMKKKAAPAKRSTTKAKAKGGGAGKRKTRKKK